MVKPFLTHRRSTLNRFFSVTFFSPLFNSAFHSPFVPYKLLETHRADFFSSRMEVIFFRMVRHHIISHYSWASHIILEHLLEALATFLTFRPWLIFLWKTKMQRDREKVMHKVKFKGTNIEKPKKTCLIRVPCGYKTNIFFPSLYRASTSTCNRFLLLWLRVSRHSSGVLHSPKSVVPKMSIIFGSKYWSEE